MSISAASSTSIQPTVGTDYPGPIQLPTGNGPYAPPPDGFDPLRGDNSDLMFADKAKGGKTEVDCPEGQHPVATVDGRTATIICVDDKVDDNKIVL